MNSAAAAAISRRSLRGPSPRDHEGGAEIEMSISEDRWFEIWFSEGGGESPLDLLIVKPDPDDRERVLILEPKHNNRVAYAAKDYEDAKHWLYEDEYHLVEGRVFPDDGW